MSSYQKILLCYDGTAKGARHCATAPTWHST